MAVGGLWQAGMEKGRVAIFDATNVTRKFRCEMVEELRSVVQVSAPHPAVPITPPSRPAPALDFRAPTCI